MPSPNILDDKTYRDIINKILININALRHAPVDGDDWYRGYDAAISDVMLVILERK